MNVLQLCAFAAPTPGNFINTLTTLEYSLKKQNINTIYAFPERAKSTDWCKIIQSRTKVYFLPESKARILPKTYRLLKKIYKENDITIVHSHFELYDIPAQIMSTKNIRVFWHLHDAIEDNYANSSKSRKILTKMQYGLLSKNVTLVSCSIKHAEFAAKLGFNNSLIKYIPNGIDTSRIKNFNSKNSILNNKKHFLMFGWDMKRKGVDLIIDAAKLIDNTNYSINIVGNDNCKSFIKEHNAPETIDFSYPEKDVNVLYNETDCFIHVSRAEGLSYALLESIYFGLPIICSDIPENRIAEEFKNIYWVRNNCVDDIAYQIQTFINNTDDLNIHEIEYNRSIIDDKYSISSWVNKIIALYLN